MAAALPPRMVELGPAEAHGAFAPSSAGAAGYQKLDGYKEH